MIPPSFDYAAPTTVDEAVGVLRDAGEDAKVIAGGQSLIPLLRLRFAAPSTLVDLGGIAELRQVREDGDALVIGAMVTHASVLRDPLINEHLPLLVSATETVADRQVRHRGTFAGSLAHADPAGDLPAVALVLGASMEVVGPSGRRVVPASEFFVDYLTSVVAPDEVLVAVRVPKQGSWVGAYEKFNRVAQGWALVGVAAMVRRDNGSIAEARVGLTNMGSTPLRATATEQALAGADSREAIGAAAARVAEGTRPSDDLLGSADYRRHLAGVLTRRAVASLS
ncbi:carbon-monoxide dehydrogenase medium subunit [Asanoa ishikariensis]|uniref:Carbon-monoxide dehydrogenase medium subunit n=1 Tax=Asanoa ishikariensis TaxID=137265 RepID=A0A1H3R1W3_9ACTN|nr:xanthine dehydrogenase family protein subunit M [Asanoa ishikariensis]GIF64547.1 carbon-monoxide dehydrogenase medium subunit [Asanoa ishikariensis]SDZ18939.1 carbon-monoxide dehydrogenase medium subunit [Asanoa ishikariensis]